MLNSYIHVFEYKEGIKFTLRVSPSYSYDYKIYQDFTNGSLDLLILNKQDEYKNGGQIINVVPDLDMVIIINADNRKVPIEKRKPLEYLIIDLTKTHPKLRK